MKVDALTLNRLSWCTTVNVLHTNKTKIIRNLWTIFVFIIIINIQALITYKIYIKLVVFKMVVSKVNQTLGKALYFSSVFVKFLIYMEKTLQIR